jgi:hypothetical protein
MPVSLGDPPSASKPPMQTGGDGNQFMLASLILGGVSGLGSAYMQSQALRAQGDYEMSVARMNQRLSEFNAQDAINRGAEAEGAQKRKTELLKGRQKTLLAAQGIDINSGSAAAILNETETMGQMDQLTIRNNAWREAFGFKIQGQNYGMQGQMAGAAANNMARNTLITGGLKAVQSGLKYEYYANGGKTKMDEKV